jgi:hypothetical protein
MADAVVMITKPSGRGAVDSEVRVHSLDELYRACRDAPPTHLVRVLLKGKDGDVTLNFGSFIRTHTGSPGERDPV